MKAEPSTDITAVTLFIRTPRDRSPEEQAIGEIAAHALFYGSTDRTRDGIALSVARVGGVLETLRTPDYVAVTCVTAPDQIEETARMLGEALKHADFTPDALKKSLDDILRARHDRLSNGVELGIERLNALLTGQEPPSDELLRHVTHEQAIRYFMSRYVPAHTVVSVVGRFTPQAVETAFQAYFAEYDRPAFPIATMPPFPEQSLPEAGRTAVTTLPTGNAAYALVGTPAPTLDSPDAPAFVVLQSLLGSGHASRLFRQVRDTLGLGYNVGAAYRIDRADPLVVYLQWDLRRSNAATTQAALTPDGALTQLNAQLDGVFSSPPDDKEIERARNIAVGHDALRHEHVRDRAFLLGWYEAVGPGYAYDTDYPRALAAVTRADVLRVAAKYLRRRSGVAVIPKP